MRRPTVDLAVDILPGLTLSDPFMVSSSHWTANERAFRALAPFTPSSLTLKTTSERLGGSGTPVLARRDMRYLEDSFGRSFARYTDGPKTQELLDTATTACLVQQAVKWLPGTKIGLSILSGEDYSRLAKSLPVGDCSYVELNLKYQFRGVDFRALDKPTNELAMELDGFFAAFGRTPTLIKLPRELTAIISGVDLTEVFHQVADRGAGVIVANSMRVTVPPSRVSGKDVRELSSGVVVGEYLILDTYHAVRILVQQCRDKGFCLPIVASGGVMDIGAVIDLMATGASGVQLCTVLDVRKPQYLEVLRQQMHDLASDAGSVRELISTIREDVKRWSQTAVTAKEFRIDARNDIAAVLSPEGDAVSVMAETIRAECENVEMPAFGRPTEAGVRPGLSFAFTRGSLTGYLMAKQCVQEYDLISLEYGSAAEFVQKLGEPGYQWDLGIFSESTLSAIEREGAGILGEISPIRIVAVATSHTELVGVSSVNLDEVTKVYHFDGGGARRALALLLEKHQVDPDDLTGPALIPLLRCWRREDGILAKPPLGRFYGQLCRQEVRQQWGPIWACDEPYWLVASKQFTEGNGGESVAQAVAWWLSDRREDYVAEADRWAIRARSEGFLNHCARLMEGQGSG